MTHKVRGVTARCMGPPFIQTGNYGPLNFVCFLLRESKSQKFIVNVYTRGRKEITSKFSSRGFSV